MSYRAMNHLPYLISHHGEMVQSIGPFTISTEKGERARRIPGPMEKCAIAQSVGIHRITSGPTYGRNVLTNGLWPRSIWVSYAIRTRRRLGVEFPIRRALLLLLFLYIDFVAVFGFFMYPY